MFGAQPSDSLVARDSILWLPRRCPRRFSARKTHSKVGLSALLSMKAGERTRTADLLITNQLLYQLSYAGKKMLTPLGVSNSGKEKKGLRARENADSKLHCQ